MGVLMSHNQAYLEAVQIIQIAQRNGLTEVDLSNPKNRVDSKKLNEIPVELKNLKNIKSLNLAFNRIKALPVWLEEFKHLQFLNLSYNQLTTFPDFMGELTQLQSLNLASNQIAELPESIGQITQLHSLNLYHNLLTKLPNSLGKLTQIKELDLSSNQLSLIPESIGQFIQLQSLNLSSNPLKALPEHLSQLVQLRSLVLTGLGLDQLPEWIGNFTELRKLSINVNSLSFLPKTIEHLTQLQVFALGDNPLHTMPIVLRKLSLLEELYMPGCKLNDLPEWVIELHNLRELSLFSNPLNSELASAHEHGLDAVKAYLRAKAESKITLNEAKLILVGEGEVGKSCLLDALLDKPFQPHDSTHGIEIQSFNVTTDSQTTITLNAWDFGGQRVYRPTHQLFFSAPAVYLVVWKPREGSQAGQVKEWIQLVKRREPSAKILVVATHGGPQQRQPDIDRQELWDLFGKETVVDFFFVESKPDEHGNRKGIDELKRAIASVAASLPEVGRSVPKSFADVRQALQDKGAPYLPLREVLDICRAHNMDDEIARLFITISHRLGHLTHYENDPTLRDIVILRPDWLATAMSFVLDDEETRAKHGLVNFLRLSHLWDDSTRAADSRYEKNLHPIFLRLMERFDLSYRVADPTSRNDSDPISLIGQLVPDIRPQNISDVWKSSPASGDIQQTQICHIVDASSGQSASAEGLFYQLIVRLHKYSLGRADYNASVHWQRGLVLEDEYKSRAFLEHVGNDVRITVRSPYPEGLLGMLTREVKFLVESFWEGLRCDVMVPCIEPCGKHTPGTGLYNVSNLIESKRDGQPKYPCPACNKWQDIDSLLRNAPAAAQQISLSDLQSEFAAIKDKLDEVNVTSRRILSQVDKTYTDLLQVLTDEAKEGPRLFSFFPVDRSAFNPKTWIREKFRLVLWCEHSRLPLPVLNNGDMKKGVYDLELEREWFKKASPYLKFLTGTLGMVLPVASSAVKLALDETAYKLIEEQLDFGKSIIDAALGETAKISDFLGAADSTHFEHGVALRSDGSTLRELHALLKAKDPGFGGLVRVMNKRQEFLWVHEKFAGEY